MTSAAEQYATEIAAIASMYTNNKSIVYKSIPAAGYWIPMLLSVAVNKANEIVDNVKKFASTDHGVNFRALLNAISESHNHPLEDFQPFFDDALMLDDQAKHLFTYESDLLAMLHDKSSASEGLWHVSHHPDATFKVELARSRQRTALDLLSEKADYLSRSSTLQKMLRNPSKDADFVGFSLKTKLSDLDPIRKGTAPSWKAFLDFLAIREEELILFQALGPFIHQRCKRFWFKKDDLIQISLSLIKQYRLPGSTTAQIENVLNQLIPDLQEALDWGLAVPFVKIGNWYMWWPFAYSVLHPNLTLLAILMRRAPDSWNNTVGSRAADVSIHLAGQLKAAPHIEIATCRVKKNVGDIDIAIYDNASDTLLICEVKTVFDRFRTNHQLNNFSTQRVNYQKAAQQLQSTQKALESGNWKIKDIFPSSRSTSTPRILKVVLTWWDIYDPYKATAFSDIATSNFLTFIYAFNQSNGNIQDLHRSMLELAALPCPATRFFHSIDDGGFKLAWSIDKQGDALPPDSDSRCQALSPLSRKLLSDIRRFPEDWKTQMLKMEANPDTIIFP